jgi:hypothetical protein
MSFRSKGKGPRALSEAPRIPTAKDARKLTVLAHTLNAAYWLFAIGYIVWSWL